MSSTTDGVQLAVEAAVQLAVAQLQQPVGSRARRRGAGRTRTVRRVAARAGRGVGTRAAAAAGHVGRSGAEEGRDRQPDSSRCTPRCARSWRSSGRWSPRCRTLQCRRSSARSTSSLQAHAEIAQTRSQTSARDAARGASPTRTARGQWGERMAEDVLRLAGFVENVNYVKQTQLEGGTGRPDFTFPLPKGHDALHGRQVPDGGLSALSRCRHRCRASTFTARRFLSRRAGCVSRSSSKRDYAEQRYPVVGRLRVAVPPQ
jgi:hypothetical protein